MEEAKALTVRLVEESRRLDPSRPVAVGGAQRQGFDVLGDIAGYNGDGASLFVDPGFPSFVSEYGSTVAQRPGKYSSGYTDGVENNPAWRSGKALWCGFHHGSFISDMGYMGMIDYFRLPLRAWYWYRKDLLGIDAPPEAEQGVPHSLKLTSDKTRFLTDGTDDIYLIVELCDANGKRISNTCNVTLEVIEGGALFPTGREIVLTPENGSFLDGAGAIELRSYYAGSIKVKATAENVQPAILEFEAEGDVPWLGQQRNIQQGPPERAEIPTEREETDIARSRPVFCSSFASEHPGMNVTDGKQETFWGARVLDSEQWIMVDLEGSKATKRATIHFAKQIFHPIKVSTSQSGTEFEALSFVKLHDNQTIELSLLRSTRYLKIEFPELPMEVQHVEIYD